MSIPMHGMWLQATAATTPRKSPWTYDTLRTIWYAFLHMVFFGWGQSHKQWQLADGRAIFVTWSYFHIFWICRFSFRVEWHLLGDKRSEDQRIFKSTARELAGDEKLDIPVLDRFGGYACIAAVLILNLFY